LNQPIPILVNTQSGSAYADAGEKYLYAMACDVGLEAKIIRTVSVDDLRRKVREFAADKIPKIAIAGGDGTVEHAVQELAGTETAMGIISQGTFNNFASTLRLHHNLPAALKTLKDGEVRSVDLGKIGDTYFTESAGIGFFADALAMYGRGSNKNFLRAAGALIRLGLSFGPRDVKVTIDGVTTNERVNICEVCNTYRIAQAVPIAPEADITDGLLDVVLVTDLHRREVPEYLRALRAQMHLGLPKVRVVRAKEVTIEARRRLNVHADDQVVGTTPQSITIMPGALKVIVDLKTV